MNPNTIRMNLKYLLALTICYFSAMLVPTPIFGQGTEWKTANGPLGADATAFYIDGRGNYWLGTGSSGGIYRSTDKGESWEAFNGGIGTAHVSWIGVINGQLHIEVADEDSIMNYKAKHPFRMYTFIGGKNWAPVADKENERLVKTAYENSRIRYESLQEQYPYTASEWAIGMDKEGIINQNHSVTEERAWLRENASQQLLTVAGIDLPNDVYSVRGWNFYLNEKNELVVLGKTNVYVLKEGTFATMGNKGLVATDISQAVETPDGNVYAVSNYRDLYRYHNKQWQLLFDSKEKGEATDVGYSYRFNVHPNGEVLTTLSGSIYSIKEGKLTQKVKWKHLKKGAYGTLGDTLAKHFKYELKDEEIFVSFSTAAYNRQGQLWAYGRVDGWPMLMRLDEEGTIVEVNRQYDNDTFCGGAFIASNPKNGDLWFFSGGYAQWLDNPEVKLPFYLDYFTGEYGNLAAFSPEGKLAFPVLENSANEFNKLLTVDTQGNQYSVVEYHTPLSSITSLGFDNKGNLYAGTGYLVSNPRDFCNWGMRGKATGLYMLKTEGWQKVQNDINPWILAASTSKNGLWVGTSGSGLYEYTPAVQGQWPSVAYIGKDGKEGLRYNNREVFATKYQKVLSYEVYNKIHGHKGVHPSTPKLSPEGLFALQEENGLWRLGSLEGIMTEEAFEGFFHTSLGGLLGFKTSNKEKKTKAYWRIALDGLKVTPLPFAKIHTFEKGYIVQYHDGTYRICNEKLAPVSRQPFEYFKQINHRIYLTANTRTEIWNVDTWKQMSNGLPFVKVGKQLSNYVETIDENGSRGILNMTTAEMLFLGRFDSLSTVGNLWVAHDKGKVGLYHATSDGRVNIEDEEWVLPMEYRFIEKVEEQAEGGSWGNGDFGSDGDFSSSNAVAIEEVEAVVLAKNDQMGIYDGLRKKWTIPCDYEQVKYLDNYLFLVKDKGFDGMYNALTDKWELALGKYTIESLSSTLLRVEQNGKKGIYRLGKGWVINPIYDDLSLLDLGEGMPEYFMIKKDGKYGLISPESKISIEPKYHTIEVGKSADGSKIIEMYPTKKRKKPEIHTPLPLDDWG